MSYHWTCQCGRSGIPIEVLQCPRCEQYRDTSMYDAPEQSDPCAWMCTRCGQFNWSADMYCMKCNIGRDPHVQYSIDIDVDMNTPKKTVNYMPIKRLLLCTALIWLFYLFCPYKVSGSISEMSWSRSIGDTKVAGYDKSPYWPEHDNANEISNDLNEHLYIVVDGDRYEVNADMWYGFDVGDAVTFTTNHGSKQVLRINDDK